MSKIRKDNEDYVWMGDHHFNGKVTGIEIEFEGVQSITGDGVGGTAENPVISYPDPADIGAATADQGALADTAVQPGDLPATPTWTTISGKPSFVAEGTNAAAARTSLGLGTAATTASSAYATAAQGALASTSVQPAALDARLSEAQRTAINALVSPTTDYADMTEATAAVKAIIDALQV